MSRNKRSPTTTRLLNYSPLRWRGTWFVLALVMGGWDSGLSGQNAATPTERSSNVSAPGLPPSNRAANVVRRNTSTNTSAQNGKTFAQRISRPFAAAGPSAEPSRRFETPYRTLPSGLKQDSAVVPAAHQEDSPTSPEQFGMTPELLPEGARSNSSPPTISRTRPVTMGAGLTIPTDRPRPPAVIGSHLGLQPGETATERSLRLMTIISELEQQNAELAEQNAKMSSELKNKDAKLQAATTQINAARKELAHTNEEFQRLKKEVAELRERFRAAEDETSSLIRSLSPLLQQMLAGDDDPQSKE